jgi:hypothetical protein
MNTRLHEFTKSTLCYSQHAKQTRVTPTIFVNSFNARMQSFPSNSVMKRTPRNLVYSMYSKRIEIPYIEVHNQEGLSFFLLTLTQLGVDLSNELF